MRAFRARLLSWLICRTEIWTEISRNPKVLRCPYLWFGFMLKFSFTGTVNELKHGREVLPKSTSRKLLLASSVNRAKKKRYILNYHHFSPPLIHHIPILLSYNLFKFIYDSKIIFGQHSHILFINILFWNMLKNCVAQ